MHSIILAEQTKISMQKDKLNQHRVVVLLFYHYPGCWIYYLKMAIYVSRIA